MPTVTQWRRGPSDPVLVVRSLSKSFARGLARSAPLTLALSEVEFELARGEIVALFGPEASGKTTLLQCAAGLLRVDAGTVELRGQPFAGGRAPDSIGYVAAVPVFYPFLTARDVLAFQAARLPQSRRAMPDDSIIEMTDLEGRADRPLVQLTREEIKRVAIAEAASRDPDVMLIDTTGLERISDRVLARLAAHGMAIMVAVRDCGSLASVATRLVHLDGGKVDRTFAPEEQLMFVAERLH